MAASAASGQLRRTIEEIARGHGTLACAAALHDQDSGFCFSLNGDRVFHAASTIKLALLLALFKAVDGGRIRLSDPLHVGDRFLRAIEDQRPESI